MPAYRPLAERFHERFIPVPESGCWLWLGSTSKGYGSIRRDAYRMALAHRIAWELHRGPVSDDTLVLHHCDVPCCVNPYHLFLGDHVDNEQDKLAKGRYRNQFTRSDMNICVHGHVGQWLQDASGERHCRECRRLQRLTP